MGTRQQVPPHQPKRNTGGCNRKQPISTMNQKSSTKRKLFSSFREKNKTKKRMKSGTKQAKKDGLTLGRAIRLLERWDIGAKTFCPCQSAFCTCIKTRTHINRNWIEVTFIYLRLNNRKKQNKKKKVFPSMLHCLTGLCLQCDAIKTKQRGLQERMETRPSNTANNKMAGHRFSPSKNNKKTKKLCGRWQVELSSHKLLPTKTQTFSWYNELSATDRPRGSCPSAFSSPQNVNSSFPLDSSPVNFFFFKKKSFS